QESQQVGLGADPDARAQAEHEPRPFGQAKGAGVLSARMLSSGRLLVCRDAPPPPVACLGGPAGEFRYLLAYGFRVVLSEALQALGAEQRRTGAGKGCK